MRPRHPLVSSGDPWIPSHLRSRPTCCRRLRRNSRLRSRWSRRRAATAEARAQAAERELASANDRLDQVADERASELIELTERLMHEVNVRERTERRMAARYAAERAVTEGNAPLDMARRVINELCRRLGWDAGLLLVARRDPRSSASTGSPSPRRTHLRFWKLTGMRLEDPRTFPVSVLDGGQPEWRVGRTGHATLDAVHAGFAGWCAFPIVVDGATSGVLLITSRAPQLPDEDLLGDLAAVGRAFGRAVERRAAVERLRITTSRLTTLISNLSGAVLLEDEARRIVLVNQPFCDTFGIPVPPESLVGSDCSSSAEQSKALFADPEGFVAGIDADPRGQGAGARQAPPPCRWAGPGAGLPPGRRGRPLPRPPVALPRRHRPDPLRRGAPRRARARRSRHAGEERLHRHDEPRDPDATQRRHQHDRTPPRDAPDDRTAAAGQRRRLGRAGAQRDRRRRSRLLEDRGGTHDGGAGRDGSG